MARQYQFVREQIYDSGTVVLPKPVLSHQSQNRSENCSLNGSKTVRFSSASSHRLAQDSSRGVAFESKSTYVDHRITSENEPYRIVDIASIDSCRMKRRGRLAISIAPGKKDTRWNRSLDADLNVIKDNGIDIIVCLLEWAEMRMLDIVDYPRRAGEVGLLFYHLPIRDRGIPSQSEVSVLVSILVQHLVNGKQILLHCRGGLGRAGTIGACCLIHFGYDSKHAIEIVRKRRPGAIQTSKQEGCIHQYYHRIAD